MLSIAIAQLFRIYSVILLVYVLMSWIPYGASKWV